MQITIAVTGASGHIGNVVCRQLIEKGFRVRALCRSDTRALEGVNVEIVPGNVLDPASLEKLVEGCDAVIHCAAIISINGDPNGMVFKTNTEGPANVLAAAARAGLRRMIHVSSVHAVEELPHNQPFNEQRPYKKAGAYPYDYSKAVGEQVLCGHAGGPEIIIVRPSAVIGPFDFKPSELGAAMVRFMRRQIPALPEGGYNFVDVRDVASSIINALETGKSGQVYHLTGTYYSMKNFAQLFQKVTGIKTTRRVLPYRLMRPMARFMEGWAKMTGTPPLFTREAIDAVKNGHPDMDNSKAVRELGHQCRPLEESIRDFYKWYQNKTTQHELP